MPTLQKPCSISTTTTTQLMLSQPHIITVYSTPCGQNMCSYFRSSERSVIGRRGKWYLPTFRKSLLPPSCWTSLKSEIMCGRVCVYNVCVCVSCVGVCVCVYVCVCLMCGCVCLMCGCVCLMCECVCLMCVFCNVWCVCLMCGCVCI